MQIWPFIHMTYLCPFKFTHRNFGWCWKSFNCQEEMWKKQYRNLFVTLHFTNNYIIIEFLLILINIYIIITSGALYIIWVTVENVFLLSKKEFENQHWKDFVTLWTSRHPLMITRTFPSLDEKHVFKNYFTWFILIYLLGNGFFVFLTHFYTSLEKDWFRINQVSLQTI